VTSPIPKPSSPLPALRKGRPPRSRRWPLCCLIACLGCLATAASPGAETVATSARKIDRDTYAQGRFVFQKNCVPCHGRFGEGDGELVKDWEVVPRNFRLATFKYRSTPYGKLPTDEDLKRTIRRGIAGTAMPTFAKLREEELKAVVEFVKFLSPDWKDPELKGEAVPIPLRPGWFADEQQRVIQAAFGRALFQESCAACHGANGAGDGLAAAGLKDSQGKPIRPADLRQPLRSGPHPEDIYRTIMTGITGTPMPGFTGTLTPEQAWQLSAHLLQLQSRQP